MFRRSFAVALLCACLILLAACMSGVSHASPTVIGFSCDAEIAYRDMTIKGRLSRAAAGTLTMEIDEPVTLSGMTISWDGEQVTVKLLGISVSLDSADIPASALGAGLLDTLDAALRTQDQAVFSDGVMRLDGECAVGSYTVLSDPETGALLSIRVPALELSASLSDFTV